MVRWLCLFVMLCFLFCFVSFRLFILLGSCFVCLFVGAVVVVVVVVGVWMGA